MLQRKCGMSVVESQVLIMLTIGARLSRLVRIKRSSDEMSRVRLLELGGQCTRANNQLEHSMGTRRGRAG